MAWKGMCGSVGAAAFVVVFAAAGRAAAQEAPAVDPPELLELYLDCNTWGCDRDFFRQEIGFVNWVRDPADAEVHVLITSQETGGGGERFTLAFLGREDFEGEDLELQYTSASTDTDDDVRRGIARMLRLGLAPYAAEMPLAGGLNVVYEDVGGKAAAPVVPEEDPWNLWVFEVGADASFDGESSEESLDLGASFSADRTTPAWKYSFYLEGGYSRDTFTFDDDGVVETVEDVRRSLFVNSLTVRSVAAHWAVGFESGVTSSTRQNRDFEVSIGPALEYSFFPYPEFTRRQLLLTYVISSAYVDYAEVTIFDKAKETLFRQSLTLAYGATQPWGEARASLRGSHYLHDLSKYNVGVGADLELRITRGLSLDLDGEAEWVRDQLDVAKEDASLEDVLLQRRELATNYRYEFRVGLSYEFGSIFNNVVNPRMARLGN
ncbi:MAG TPA: hypothetical protein VF188_05860 [Longimicrobiales bacterium]